MKNKSQITSLFKKKISEIKKHNDYYFNKDRPVISDKDYDNLKREIIELQNKYKFLKDQKPLENLVGSPPTNKFKKVKHLRPMLSLSNAFDKDDMEDFIKKIKNFLNLKNEIIEFFVNLKLTGFQLH